MRTPSSLPRLALLAAFACQGTPDEPAQRPVPRTTWLVVQNAKDLALTFDASLYAGCAANDGLWSGTIALLEADPDTLWFTDRPEHVSFTMATDAFVADFPTLFDPAGAGAPNAVLSWDEAGTGVDHNVVVVLSHPWMTNDTLHYKACGLPLHDEQTLEVLPADAQYVPPANPPNTGSVSLFIDSVEVQGTADDSPPEPTFSTIGLAAIAALEAEHAADRGHTWQQSRAASMDSDWLIPVPAVEAWGQSVAAIEAEPVLGAFGTYHPDFELPYCEKQTDCAVGTCLEVQATIERVDDTPDKLCMGHSDRVWDEMYSVLASAESYADVSSLDFPDNPNGTPGVAEGRFLVALRNALRTLDSKDRDIDVRMMFGWLTDDTTWDSKLQVRFEALTDGLGASTKVNLWVAAMNYELLSWNHSKIVAADGEELIVGGINFYSTDYLHTAPVRDLSIHLRGQPALDSHRYLDGIWDAYATEHRAWFTASSTAIRTLPSGLKSPKSSPAATTPASTDTTGVPVITMGRHGLIDRVGVDYPAPSDDAMIAAIDAANESLWFSLQDLGPVDLGSASYDWPTRLMTTLTRKALKSDFDLKIVLSAPGAGAYSYGWTLEDVLTHWRTIIETDPALSAEVQAAGYTATTLLCERVSLASIRINDTDATWAGGMPMGNHSKFWVVDAKAFYVGSQNLYISNLFEWGVLVDDAARTQEAIAAFWTPTWTYSQLAAVSGPGVADCALD
jgi:phosphatidylserine/phosphatidylglycerophosphate/cardiolipin synthase-like enzyme